MPAVYKYEIYCETEEANVYTWAETTPTKCPNNDDHTIDTESISIVQTLGEEAVELSGVSTSSDGYIEVVEQPREGNAQNYYCPNFCDKTSWYPNATTVSEFELTDSGDLTTWNTDGTHPGPWIDLYHGKMFAENDLITATPTLGMVVEASEDDGETWDEKTQNTFGDTSTGDYDVDYTNGTVTFNSALSNGDRVRASFSKAPSTLTWTVAPPSNKELRLMYAEAQFTKDCAFTADIVYETWAYNPSDLPNKIKIGEMRYKTMSDLLYETTGSYPVIPSFTAESLRVFDKDVVIFPFKYNTMKNIKDSLGVEIRVCTAKEHTGTWATTTLYCLMKDEE